MEAINAFKFLSNRRGYAIGMSGGVPLSIPLSDIVDYHTIFSPTFDLKHFLYVVTACDSQWISDFMKNAETKKTIDKKVKRR